MTAHRLALFLACGLLASCGGNASDGAASTAETQSAGVQADAVAAAPVTTATVTPATATAGGTPADKVYGPGELLAGGAVDVLQREGFRGPAA